MSKTIKTVLEQSKTDSLDTELLIAHVSKKSREYVLAHPEKKLSFLQTQNFKKMIKKRKAGISLAYLVRHKSFYGLNFFVDKNVLIPRPETEMIVDEALSIFKNNKKNILIDVGTGSGCIPIAIAKNLQLNSATLQLVATDISRKALRIAIKNAKKHNVKIKFLQGNLLESILNNVTMKQFNNVIITANLPYLTEKQYKSEPSIQHEPKKALVAKNMGLGLYEKLFQQINQLLTTPQLLQLTVLIEIDPAQTGAIQNLIKQYLPNRKIEIKKDLSKNNRIVIIKKSA